MRDVIENMRTKIDESSLAVKTLTQEDMWSRHEVVIWQADRFVGSPCFYPVYKWKNFYSYSLFALIVKKGSLSLNAQALKARELSSYLMTPSSLCIDTEIERIGGPHAINNTIQDVETYANEIANALKNDTSQIEHANLDCTNYVMCGGKDSLNLLLLPWINKTVALSAAPNFPLVEQFVRDNDLQMEVVELKDDEDPKLLKRELLENCCRMDPQHWRWTAGLRSISKDHQGKVILWKGQMADLYMTNKWKTYLYHEPPYRMIIHKVLKKISPYIPRTVRTLYEPAIHKFAIHCSWHRGAVMQGAHVAFIREVADCLTLSAYHGPRMSQIFASADLPAVAQEDMRNKVGKLLLGRDVQYPTSNPTPPPSLFRNNKNLVAEFTQALEAGGINVDRCV